MASSKVVTTNPDLPRESSICSLSNLLADLHHTNNNPNDPSKNITMDDLLKSIYSSEPNPDADADAAVAAATSNNNNNNHNHNNNNNNNISRQGSFSVPKDMAPRSVDEVWKEIVAGTDSQPHTHRNAGDEPLEAMTLEDFLTKAGAVSVRHDDDVGGVPTILPLPGINGAPHFAMEGSSLEPFGNGIEGSVVGVAPPAGRGRGKRRAVVEPADKATLQKQRRMIKNRESAARSRERKQAYTVELESLVTHLEEENARLLREEAEKNKQRFKQLMECLIPIVEKRKPRRMLRRVNSVHW